MFAPAYSSEIVRQFAERDPLNAGVAHFTARLLAEQLVSQSHCILTLVEPV
jgi:hypothetical protein